MEPKIFSKTSGLLLLGILVSIFGMILTPISPACLDLFLGLNLTAAILLLLVACYISDTMKIASFPTILLVATLFRLALEIASTRLILATGDAGEVIRTFGELAVAGNLVIGVIVFLMVTFVQFVVIAKGSERVAEVAARFNLDALPGRQMSIDADLRAGVISGQEAREAREKLRQESRLFGAMDGAMKFVKGDAIAGIFITGINLIGGLAMGVLVRGLTFSQALQTYSLMTIGSGLVSQIPSLLISLAAGIILTRIASADNSHLGHEITTQILKQPQALGAGALLIAALGLVPGFPTILFFGIALVVGGLAYTIASLRKSAEQQTQKIRAAAYQKVLPASSPITLELSPGLYQTIHQDPAWTNFRAQLLSPLVQFLANETGINLPPPRLTEQANLGDLSYLIKVQDIVVAEGRGSPAKEALLRHIAQVLRQAAPRFLTLQEVKNRLRQLESIAPDLVQEVIPRMIQIQKLTDVLQRLAQEWLSIQDLQRILHEISLLHPEDKDPVTLAEQLRSSLKDQITARFAGRSGVISVFLLDEEIEDQVQRTIHRGGQESYLMMPPNQISSLMRSITHQVAPSGGKVRGPILTQPEVRRFVHKILETKHHFIPVLSYNELEPDVVIRPLGRISLNHSMNEEALWKTEPQRHYGSMSRQSAS